MLLAAPGVAPSALVAPVVLVEELVAPIVLLLDVSEALGLLGESDVSGDAVLEGLVDEDDRPALLLAGVELYVELVPGELVLVESGEEVVDEDGLVEAVLFRLPLVVSVVVL
jgi:hypothetical protein